MKRLWRGPEYIGVSDVICFAADYDTIIKKTFIAVNATENLAVKYKSVRKS